MKTIKLASIKKIYRLAIDPDVDFHDSSVWWEEVASQITKVIIAPSDLAAAEVITWWHPDWTKINDSPLAAATRLRQAGTKVLSVCYATMS